MTGDELKVLARGRRKEHKVGGIKLRDFRLVSDKAQADCVEAMMGCCYTFSTVGWRTAWTSWPGLGST